MNLQKIQLSKLSASAQPRPLLTTEVDKLAASIKDVGLIQPITVTAFTQVSGIAEPGWQIIAGHHRVAACRALGWAEIDALVIDDVSHLQSELIEIDENLCRAELTASQRTGYTKRRKQIWEALHPEEQVRQLGAPVETAKHGHAQYKGFAASTAEITGESLRGIQRHIARADALGDDVERITGTSLDSGVEMDALAKLPEPERTEIIDRAVAGEQVSARPQSPPAPAKSMADRHVPITLYKAVRQLLSTMGCSTGAELRAKLGGLQNLTKAERETLDAALVDLAEIGILEAD